MRDREREKLREREIVRESRRRREGAMEGGSVVQMI